MWLFKSATNERYLYKTNLKNFKPQNSLFVRDLMDLECTYFKFMKNEKSTDQDKIFSGITAKG